MESREQLIVTRSGIEFRILYILSFQNTTATRRQQFNMMWSHVLQWEYTRVSQSLSPPTPKSSSPKDIESGHCESCSQANINNSQHDLTRFAAGTLGLLVCAWKCMCLLAYTEVWACTVCVSIGKYMHMYMSACEWMRLQPPTSTL